MTERLDYAPLAPGYMEAFGQIGKQVARSGLRKALIDLVYLRVSQINGCAYCIDTHSRDLIKDGFSVDKLVLVQAWREGGALFTERERAALAWAETVTRVADTGVPDESFAAAKKEFSDKEITDLTMAIALINAYNRLGVSFRTVPVGVREAIAKS